MNRFTRWLLRQSETIPDPEVFDNLGAIEYRFFIETLQVVQDYQRKLMALNQQDYERRCQYENSHFRDIFQLPPRMHQSDMNQWTHTEWKRVQQQINLLITGNTEGLPELTQDQLYEVNRREQERKEAMFRMLRGE